MYKIKSEGKIVRKGDSTEIDAFSIVFFWAVQFFRICFTWEWNLNKILRRSTRFSPAIKRIRSRHIEQWAQWKCEIENLRIENHHIIESKGHETETQRRIYGPYTHRSQCHGVSHPFDCVPLKWFVYINEKSTQLVVDWCHKSLSFAIDSNAIIYDYWF